MAFYYAILLCPFVIVMRLRYIYHFNRMIIEFVYRSPMYGNCAMVLGYTTAENANIVHCIIVLS